MGRQRMYRILVPWIVGMGLVGATGLTACGGGGDQAASSSGGGGSDGSMVVRVTEPAVAAYMWPVYVAEDEGIFKRLGLHVTRGLTQGPAATISAISSGSADVGAPFASEGLAAIDKGAPVTYIAADANRQVSGLVGAKGVTQATDLRGKGVAVTSKDDLFTAQVVEYLDQHGLPPDQYHLVISESSSARLAALKSGGVAAANLVPPLDHQATLQGFSRLALLNTSNFASGELANKDFVAKKPKAAAAYVKAVGEAITWLYKPQNRQEAIDILARKTKVTPDAAKAAYEAFVAGKVFADRAQFDRAAFDRTIKALERTGRIGSGDHSFSDYVTTTPQEAGP